MFNDRYMPIDANDDYELTREEPGRHSHKHDRKHKKSKKERHREGSRERHRHREGKVEQEGQTERLPTTQAADELEDGEIMEDGEVQEAPQQVNSGRPSNADEEADRLSEQRRSSSPNGDTRKRQRSSSRAPTDPGEKSVSQDHSQDAAAIASRDKSKEPLPPVNSSRDRRNSRERSRERSTSRRRDREQLLQDERPPRHGSRDYRSSGDTAVRSDSRQHDRSDRDRDRHRDRDRDRERGRYDRDRERYEQYDRERVDRDRHRADSRAHDDRRRRISRSRSRDRRAGAPRSFEERERERAGAKSYEEREKERNSQKRSRDDRDRGEDGKRHRRSHSSDEELPDLPDPDSLTVVDALGLTAAEREAEEEQKRLEESRRRRQEILAKHQQAATVAAPTATAAAANGQPVQQQQPEQQQKPEQNGMGDAAASTLATEAAAETDVAAKAAAGAQGTAPLETAAAAATDVQDGTATPEGERSSSDDSQNAPGPVLDIWNKGQDADGEVNSREVQAAEEPTSQLPVHLVAQTEPNMQSERLRVGGGGVAGGGQKAAADDDAGDMFAADDDMFAAEGDAAVAGPKKAAVPAGLQDNYDDAEGYYNFQVGEVLDSRYEVFACKGKGVFSTVLRARDLLRYINNATGQLVAAGTAGAEHPEVAIKVIRSNETMSKAAALEQRILRMLSEKDPDSKKHVIRLLRTFEFRQHVCMVFEPMDMNLRELTLKYGRNVGLNITAVAIYASQLLVALRHLQQCRILHADIKPDNILVNARRSKVKICDLGSAMLAGENERTPYLVSRFYRAPEVILGLAYDFSMDMWSVGCVLYELFTGKILFPGRTNNEMLKLMMDVKGPFPKKMLKKGIFVEKHFEDDVQTSFALIEEDPVTKQPVRRVISNPTAKHNFAQLLTHSEGDRAQVTALADLLERMCALDPEKRIDPDAALRHPFIKPWLPKKKSGAGH